MSDHRDRDSENIVELPIDGTLDLHQFRPEELSIIVPEYVAACLERGIDELRIVHGKGRGVLRRGLWSLLERLPEVAEYHLAGAGRGEWGATIVRLRFGAAPPRAK